MPRCLSNTESHPIRCESLFDCSLDFAFCSPFILVRQEDLASLRIIRGLIIAIRTSNRARFRKEFWILCSFRSAHGGQMGGVDAY